MEEKQLRPHEMNLYDRKRGAISGVQDVISFDPEMILLKTTRGMLTIKGKELHVSRLQLEKGEADVEGQFDSFIYTQEKLSGTERSKSLLGRLFR